MKKRLLFSLMAVLMLSLTFISCGDDDDDAVDYKTAIVGKWKWTHDVEYTDGKVERDRDVSDRNEFVEYKSDGTVVWTDGEETEQGTWFISGDKLTEVYDGDGEVSIISISGNTLTITSEETEDGHTYKDVATFTRL
ncbi:MAG: lipocalin family protein [Bacteroidales bacterium]|nr:lipocalin family protein [Bacteroidales bacterium]